MFNWQKKSDKPALDTTHKTVKIRFKDHTPVDIEKVSKEHFGAVQLRDYSGNDPKLQGAMEYYFPAGREIEIHDYVASGAAEIIE